MKLFRDGSSKSCEIVGAVLRCVLSTGDSTQLAPIINQPSAKTAAGILGGIAWGRIRGNYLEDLPADGSWKFLHIVCDAAATNFKIPRRILSDTMRFPRLLANCTPCYAHVLSLVVKWGLGKRYDYGGMLRT